MIVEDLRTESRFSGPALLREHGVVSSKTVKIFGWYDNEWGYSNRTVDLVRFIGERL